MLFGLSNAFSRVPCVHVPSFTSVESTWCAAHAHNHSCLFIRTRAAVCLCTHDERTRCGQVVSGCLYNLLGLWRCVRVCAQRFVCNVVYSLPSISSRPNLTDFPTPDCIRLLCYGRMCIRSEITGCQPHGQKINIIWFGRSSNLIESLMQIWPLKWDALVFNSIQI